MTSLILIDSRVKHIDVIVKCLAPNVQHLVYDYDTEIYESLLVKVKEIGDSFEYVSFVSHKKNESFKLLKCEEFRNSFVSFRDFIVSFNAPVIDFLICKLYQDKIFKNFMCKVEKQTGVNLRASIDNTGTLLAGANWVMESDNVDVRNIYFTEEIENYSFVFGIDTFYSYLKSNEYNNTNVQYQVPGTVKVWGDASSGGNPASVTTLNNVRAIYSNATSFAALRENGTVYSWGDNSTGGIGEVSVSNVLTIYNTGTAFAALRNDGTVYSWGDAFSGGIGEVPVNNVLAIFSNDTAFAALRNDGTVYAWGDVSNGGIGEVSVSNVKFLYSTQNAFVALRNDGTVYAWGDAIFGGIGEIPVNDVKNIFITRYSVAALKNDGTVYSWGFDVVQGTVAGLNDVKNVYTNGGAFAALRNDGTVFVWGTASTGGLPSQVSSLIDVKTIYANSQAFSALRNDGTVYSWGNVIYSAIGEVTNNTSIIYSNLQDFSAIKNDGTVYAWNNIATGGIGNVVGLNSPTYIYSNLYSFAATKADKSVFVWGDSLNGGDPAQVVGINNITTILPTYFAYAALIGAAEPIDVAPFAPEPPVPSYNIIITENERLTKTYKFLNYIPNTFTKLNKLLTF